MQKIGIKGVMSSAAEAELGAMYINARKAVEIRIILEEMGHKQPATPIQVDNSTAESIVNKRVQPKRTKAMDMRFHWLRDRSMQNQFRFYWRPGTTNYADYWTKHPIATMPVPISSIPPSMILLMAPTRGTTPVPLLPSAPPRIIG